MLSYHELNAPAWLWVNLLIADRPGARGACRGGCDKAVHAVSCGISAVLPGNGHWCRSLPGNCASRSIRSSSHSTTSELVGCCRSWLRTDGSMPMPWMPLQKAAYKSCEAEPDTQYLAVTAEHDDDSVKAMVGALEEVVVTGAMQKVPAPLLRTVCAQCRRAGRAGQCLPGNGTAYRLSWSGPVDARNRTMRLVVLPRWVGDVRCDFFEVASCCCCSTAVLAAEIFRRNAGRCRAASPSVLPGRQALGRAIGRLGIAGSVECSRSPNAHADVPDSATPAGTTASDGCSSRPTACRAAQRSQPPRYEVEEQTASRMTLDRATRLEDVAIPLPGSEHAGLATKAPYPCRWVRRQRRSPAEQATRRSGTYA